MAVIEGIETLGGEGAQLAGLVRRENKGVGQPLDGQDAVDILVDPVIVHLQAIGGPEVGKGEIGVFSRTFRTRLEAVGEPGATIGDDAAQLEIQALLQAVVQGGACRDGTARLRIDLRDVTVHVDTRPDQRVLQVDGPWQRGRLHPGRIQARGQRGQPPDKLLGDTDHPYIVRSGPVIRHGLSAQQQDRQDTDGQTPHHFFRISRIPPMASSTCAAR